VPPVQRTPSAERQIIDFFKREILEGRLVQGDRLPSVRSVAADWGVAQGTAQAAYRYLDQVEHLVRGETGSGTFVDAPRAVIGPQQRARMTADPATQPAEIRFAGVTEAPEYIASTLDLPEGSPVIRRETVTRRPSGETYMLSVSWVPPQFAIPVPELLLAVPLPDPRGAAHLITARTETGAGVSGAALEARPVRDDGREAPLLGLRRGSFVLAGVHVWTDDRGVVIEYEEYVLPPGQVIEFELQP
jgi:GntR family transcriptional regulator